MQPRGGAVSYLGSRPGGGWYEAIQSSVSAQLFPDYWMSDSFRNSQILLES